MKLKTKQNKNKTKWNGMQYELRNGDQFNLFSFFLFTLRKKKRWKTFILYNTVHIYLQIDLLDCFFLIFSITEMPVWFFFFLLLDTFATRCTNCAQKIISENVRCCLSNSFPPTDWMHMLCCIRCCGLCESLCGECTQREKIVVYSKIYTLGTTLISYLDLSSKSIKSLDVCLIWLQKTIIINHFLSFFFC